MFFSQAKSAELTADAKREGRTLAPAERARQLGEMWQLVKGTDAVKVYEQMHADDQARFEADKRSHG